MSKRWKVLLTLSIATVVLITGLVFGFKKGSTDLAAREKLDHMLGEQPQGELPFEYSVTPPPQTGAQANDIPLGFLGLPLPNPLTGGMSDSGVNVQENANAYVLRIPLTNLADADNVKANVTPNHIEVSGKVGHQEKGVSFSSSFVQSFSTSQPVLPDKVTQKTEKAGDKTTLVITVPKQYPGKSNQELQPPPTPEAPQAPKPPENVLENNDGMPDRAGHRVI